MNKIKQLVEFLNFNIKATNQHGIHSPFLFDFYNHVISDDRRFYDFGDLERIRHSYLNNHNNIEIVELGAGSSYNNSSSKKISEVAKQQLSSAYQLRTLYRLIDYIGAKNSVELGSSLGLSSFYMASAKKEGYVTTFEGNPHFVKFIEHQKQLLGIENLEVIEGNFDKTYSDFLGLKPKIDFAFIDGNHREEPTINYFKQTIPCLHENSVMVFDDIHWSDGMYQAWKEIIAHPKVTASMDMFIMGIVFFRTDFKEERHLKIRPKSFR